MTSAGSAPKSTMVPINFRDEGLTPGSEVVVDETVVGSTTFTADADGSFDPGNSQGLISVFANTVFTLEVTATGAYGNALTGQITRVRSDQIPQWTPTRRRRR